MRFPLGHGWNLMDGSGSTSPRSLLPRNFPPHLHLPLPNGGEENEEASFRHGASDRLHWLAKVGSQEGSSVRQRQENRHVIPFQFLEELFFLTGLQAEG